MRRVKEGTSAILMQSGLDEKWWADSMECYCHLRSIQDLLYEGKTHHERLFGEPFKGPVVPLRSDYRISPYFFERPIAIASVRPESLARHIPWICVTRWGNLERRHLGRRH